MKFADINRRFTEKVAEYIAKGYTINTATISGSQGEIGKVDLTNGEELIRINLRTFNGCDDIGNRDFWYEGVKLEIGKCTDKIEVNSNSTWNTFWSSHMDIVETEEFYKIGENRRACWYGTREEALAAYILRWSRFYNYRMKNENKELGEEEKKAVLSFVRRQPKCKTASISDITVVKKINGNIVDYIVECKGRTYRLH